MDTNSNIPNLQHKIAVLIWLSCLIVSICFVLPQAVYANDTVIDSGVCGDSVTWSLTGTDSKMILTISGSGPMRDFTPQYMPPWAGKQAKVKKVIIEKGVTSIGAYSFYQFDNLIEVTIPYSVTSIERSAFEGCKRLSSIAIPDTISSLEQRTFFKCESLTSVTIPDSVTTIKNQVFLGCSSLKSVYIPDSVTSTGAAAFSGCSNIDSVYITDIRAWCEISFFWNSGNPMYYGANLYLNGKMVSDLMIPKGVTSINNYAFNGCNSITNVTIPETVTSVGKEAFYSCKKLSSINIPDDVISIGENAFNKSSYLVVREESYSEAYAKDNDYNYDLTTGHQIDGGTKSKSPNCDEEGIIEYRCNTCHRTIYKEAIPTIGHKWNSTYTVDKKATYAAAGSKSIHCSVCGAKKPGSVISIPKLKVKGTKLTKVTAAKKGFTAKWKKGTGVNGYEIQYALNKKFTKGKKIVKITKPGTVSKKVAKLKAKKKYFVRIRTYKTVRGKKYYSRWSKAKSVTTK